MENMVKLKFILAIILCVQIVSTLSMPSEIIYSEKINSNSSNVVVEESSDKSDIKIIKEEEEPQNNFQLKLFSETKINTNTADGQLKNPEGNLDSDTISYKFRGPDLFASIKANSTQPLSEADQRIQDTWGGNCLSEDWEKCNKITKWGGNYYVPDKRDPEKMILMHKEIECFTGNEKYYCLQNGWSVSRCHMMCMSCCNKDYILKYDQVVKHEGLCFSPVG